MRLALQTDYALRTLMYLGTRRERTTVDQVAGFFGISRAHVAKVVNQLARIGLLRSIRGLGGGIELAKPSDSISVGAVIAAFEGDMHLLDCTGSDGVCRIESFCRLKQVLSEAERIQLEYLDSVMLSDVTPTSRQVARIAASDS